MEEKKGRKTSFFIFTTSLELGFYLAIPVLVFTLIGKWLDRFFNSGFLFLVIGATLGIVIATVITVKKVSFLIKEADRKYEEDKKERSS